MSEQLPLNVETATAHSGLGVLFKGAYVVAQLQRFEIRLFGTSIRAEGIAGIIGAVAFGLILVAYLRS